MLVLNEFPATDLKCDLGSELLVRPSDTIMSFKLNHRHTLQIKLKKRHVCLY